MVHDKLYCTHIFVCCFVVTRYYYRRFTVFHRKNKHDMKLISCQRLLLLSSGACFLCFTHYFDLVKIKSEREWKRKPVFPSPPPSSSMFRIIFFQLERNLFLIYAPFSFSYETNSRPSRRIDFTNSKKKLKQKRIFF